MNYYIQGNEEKAEQINAAFNKLGYSDRGFTFDVNEILFFTANANNNHINVCPANGWLANIIKTHPDYKELELPIEPCFNVGDKIEATIYGIERKVTIREVDKTNRCYFGTLEECIGFSEQDQWHLASKPHYDISNFKPFDKVLGRNCCRSGVWRADLFSHIHKNGKLFVGIGYTWEQCIPFNDDTKHLLGTTKPCSEEYINW